MAGDLLRTSLHLWGESPRYLPVIIKALQRLEREGIGKGRRKIRLSQIVDGHSSTPIYKNGNLDLSSLRKQPLNLSIKKNSAPAVLRVDFEAPLKLQHRGEALHAFDFGELVFAAADRLWIIAHLHGAPWLAPGARALVQQGRESEIELIEDKTTFVSFSRFSHRQNRRHELSGVVGHMVFAGPLTPFMPLLKAGQLFHLGKGTNFGLGAIKITREHLDPVSKTEEKRPHPTFEPTSTPGE